MSLDALAATISVFVVPNKARNLKFGTAFGGRHIGNHGARLVMQER